MIRSLVEICDAHLQNVVIRDEETKHHRIVGRTGFVCKGDNGFWWTRDGVKFNSFDPNNDRQLGVAVVACGLLYKPWKEQRQYRRQHKQAQAIASTYARRAAKRASNT